MYPPGFEPDEDDYSGFEPDQINTGQGPTIKRAQEEAPFPYTGSRFRQPVQAPPDDRPIYEDVLTELNRPHIDFHKLLPSEPVSDTAAGRAALNTLPFGLGKLGLAVADKLGYNLGADTANFSKDMASGATSDIGILTSGLLPEERLAAMGVTKGANYLQNIRRGASGIFAFEGAKTALDPNATIPQRVMGGANAVLGTLGAVHANDYTPKPQPSLEDLGTSPPPSGPDLTKEFNTRIPLAQERNPNFREPEFPGPATSRFTSKQLTKEFNTPMELERAVPETDRPELNFDEPDFYQPSVFDETPAANKPGAPSGQSRFSFNKTDDFINAEQTPLDLSSRGPSNEHVPDESFVPETREPYFGTPPEVENAQPRKKSLFDRSAQDVINENPPVREGGEYDSFRDAELQQAGTGQPGLSVEETRPGGFEHTIAFRDSQGNPLAVARIVPGESGPQVFSIASSKKGGLATGRALKTVIEKIKEFNPTEIGGGLSPDAQNLVKRLGLKTAETPAKPGQRFGAVGDQIRNFFKEDKGSFEFDQPDNPKVKNMDDHIENTIMNEKDPAIIEDNFNNWNQEFQWAKIHGTPDEIERAGFFRDVALDRLNQHRGVPNIGERGPKFDLPNEAATGVGKIGIGANIKELGKVLGSSLYSGNVSKVVTKELVQNSLDATRHLGEEGKVDVTFDHHNNTINVTDNGKGMTKQEVETVFTDLGESGKRSDESAIGGFGLAKAAPLLAGEHAKLVTVARHSDGKLYETSFEGTPDQLLDGSVDLKHHVVPEGTPTGTRVTTKIPENKFSAYESRDYLNMLSKYSEFPGQIHMGETYSKLPATLNPIRKLTQGKKLVTLETPQGKVHLHLPNDVKIGDNSAISLILRNKGMVQSIKQKWLGKTMPNIPDKVIVDIDTAMPEGHSDYPFTANREDLRGQVQKEVSQYIDEKVVKPALEQVKDKLKASWEAMPAIRRKDGTVYHIFDDKGYISNEKLNQMMNSQAFGNIISYNKILLDQILDKMGIQSWTDKLERTGISFDPKHYGVHVPNPGTGKSGIFLNPFIHLIENAKEWVNNPTEITPRLANPEQAAAGIVHTIIHEAAHIEPLHTGDAHNAEFAGRVADITTKLGVHGVNNANLNALNLLTERGGNYRPEVIHLLSEYKNAIRSGSSKEASLTSTGTESATGRTPESGEVLPERTETSRESAFRKRPVRPTNPTGEHLTSAFNKPIKSQAPPSRFNRTVEAPPNIPGVAKPATAAEVNKIQQAIPQKELPQRVENISNHVTEDKLQGVTKDEKESLFRKARNAQRTILTAYDVSAPGRQGLPLAYRPEYWKAYRSMYKAWGNEGAFQTIMDSIKHDPSGFFAEKPIKNKPGTGSLAYQAGLELTDALTKHEEMFASKWAEENVPGVRNSTRAYTAFLNKLRADVFKNIVRAGGYENNLVEAKKIADFINIATGRGSLGAFEGSARGLSELFFSPRLTISRLQMYKRVFDPRTYANTNKAVRMEVLKSALTTAGIGLLMGEMARMRGAEVSNDPTNSDFRKIKLGNTRIDPFAGHQQFLVAAAKMLTGKSTSSTSGRTTDMDNPKFGQTTRADVFERLLTNKLAPVPSFVWAWMQGKEFDGTPFNAKKALMQRTVPIVMQDLYEIGKQDPTLVQGLLAGTAAISGFGVQTYGR